MRWRYTKKLFRFWRTNSRTFWLLPRLCAWLIFISYAAKFCTLQKLFRFVAPRKISKYRLTLPPEKLVALVDRLLSLNVWIFSPTCWKRAIILHRYLALQGIPSQIIFGVRKGEGHLLDGHAWLESQGQPLYEAEPPNYLKTLIFP